MVEEQQTDILVVEDNEEERESIVAALTAAIKGVCVVGVASGEEAMEFLSARTEAGDEAPRLILLDLEMPGEGGISVLGQIRSVEPRNALTLTPIVIFTDSSSSENVRDSYTCGANSYIIKPLSFRDFNSVVKMVGEYWMTHNITTY